jgi:hypothetical protein
MDGNDQCTTHAEQTPKKPSLAASAVGPQLHRMTDAAILARARHDSRSTPAGLAALGAGIAWVAWVTINSRTHGGLDAGPSAVGEPLARVGTLLMVAWNLLLLPAALALGDELAPRARERMRVATLAGIASLLFWAFGGAAHTITTPLEVTYIALSAVWWGGIGVTIRAERRWFGTFTLVLAAFAAWDAFLTAFMSVPFGLYLTAAPKLPLSIIWDFWLAYELMRATE